MTTPDLDRATEALLAVCGELRDPQPSAALRAATGGFSRALGAVRQPPERALAALATMPPAGAAWIALTLGSAVEAGLEAEWTAPALVDLLRAWLAPLSSDDAPERDDDEAVGALLGAERVAALTWLGQSLVAHLARLPARRAVLAADAGLRDALRRASSVSHGALWLEEMLLRQSGELIVLHVESGRGLCAEVHDVGRCFHLFTLLQGAIGTGLPGGREPDSALLGCARGGPWSGESDAAWWHYQHGLATESHYMNSIWAEWTLDDLPRMADAWVVVLWPPVVGGRHWGASFFGPPIAAAPPRVEIERELAASESAAWFERIGIVPGACE